MYSFVRTIISLERLGSVSVYAHHNLNNDKPFRSLISTVAICASDPSSHMVEPTSETFITNCATACFYTPRWNIIPVHHINLWQQSRPARLRYHNCGKLEKENRRGDINFDECNHAVRIDWVSLWKLHSPNYGQYKVFNWQDVPVKLWFSGVWGRRLFCWGAQPLVLHLDGRRSNMQVFGMVWEALIWNVMAEIQCSTSRPTGNINIFIHELIFKTSFFVRCLRSNSNCFIYWYQFSFRTY